MNVVKPADRRVKTGVCPIVNGPHSLRKAVETGIPPRPAMEAPADRLGRQLRSEIARNPRLSGLWGGAVEPRDLGNGSIEIAPGRTIFIDPRLVEAPAALAVVLRYAFEWQIWREHDRGLSDGEIDVLALSAAAGYCALLTVSERDQLAAIANHALREAIVSRCDRPLTLDAPSEAACAALRGATRPGTIRIDTVRELLPLAVPVENLLVSGCDARSRFDPRTGRIAYRSRPFPAPERFCFASSTAATISARAYQSCERARQGLIAAAAVSGWERASTAFCHRQRSRMVELLDLGNDVDVVFCPSGSDAELFVLHIARSICGTPLVNILVAADETGRSAALAAGARHFTTVSAHDVPLEEGCAIPELADGVELVRVPLRDEDGNVRSVDRQIEQGIRAAVQEGKKVLLHMMDCSKFGSRCPSLPMLDDLLHRYRGRMHVIVDACQLRTSRARLRWYLDRGCIVVVTGSKFFAAPPFCGAILLPKKTLQADRIPRLPFELGHYSDRDSWPEQCQTVRSALPAPRKNLGLMFRWHAAIEGMSDYFSLPAPIRAAALAAFEREVGALIRQTSFLQPVERTDGDFEPGIDEEMAHRSILPFFIVHHGQVLSAAQVDTVHTALDRDISPLLRPDADDEARKIAAQLCHLGHPVYIRHPGGAETAILRLSAGVTGVLENAIEADGRFAVDMSREVGRAAIVIAKIGMILTYLD